MDKQESTVTYIRRLPPYNILKGSHNEDPFVSKFIGKVADQPTLDALSSYTRGMYTPELHYESFLHYSRPLTVEEAHSKALQTDPHIQRAKELVYNIFNSLPKCQLIRSDQMDTIKYIGSSAAGYGYVGNKRVNYHRARLNASRALRYFERFGTEYRMVPDKAFSRSQLALRASPKIRHVWGRAFHHILIESLIGQPLIQMLLQHDNPIFIGRDIHRDMPLAIHSLLGEYTPWCYCLDFSKFDSSVNSDLVAFAWDVLYSMLIIRDDWEENIYQFCRHLFCNTPLVMPDGKLYMITTGVPSGSYFTQFVDSIANLVLIFALQLKFVGRTFDTKVLGDDSVFMMPLQSISLDQAAEWFAQFGMTLNIEKSITTRLLRDIVFLGHNFYGSSVTRDEFTCLSLALFTEDPIYTPQESILRLVSLLYDSGFNSHCLYRLYKILLDHYDIDWSKELQRPVDIKPPFVKLFALS